MNGEAPKYLEDLWIVKSQIKPAVPLPKTNCYKQSFSYSG